MIHQEYKRIVPGSDTAVLFVHGILGTPNHFSQLLPLVQQVPEKWSVYNVLLDGHGGRVEDFAHTSMKKWKSQVWEVFNSLAAEHERVIIAAHSMGPLFAIQLALENPETIPFLFLIACPLRPGLQLFGIVNMMRLVFGKIREDHPIEVATSLVCGVKTTRKLWKCIAWLPRFLELFAEIYHTEKHIGELVVPCVSYQSEKDELVRKCSLRVLEKFGTVEVHNLLRSTHFYYHPEDKDIVCSDFINRCNKKTHS